ncbi:putative entry exclusion protein TrbK-alt [Roseobacter sp.]|uniref:putative entry exclusion protein TrbK-alt n=1 Tax=Roseobacter sp. TaxID=1907202 RepID=UPI0029670943|nr:putative entry exclusion protein TrbK-alt [Roseobacter sp.]MDW3181507.1 putative entry exclusion protein TrbK-alt [Roseobacter sp.]
MALDTPRILRLVAFGVGGLAALAAVVELTRTVLPTDTGHVVRDNALSGTLARCRDLTPEDYATDTECRAAWKAARQRFFDLTPESAGTE